ncbi:MAG: hypothetical protein [Microvirus sp.]|nr:MAG: hypothetical protein [Microvirus sp.]
MRRRNVDIAAELNRIYPWCVVQYDSMTNAWCFFFPEQLERGVNYFSTLDGMRKVLKRLDLVERTLGPRSVAIPRT